MRLSSVLRGVTALLGIAAIGIVAAILESPAELSSAGGGGAMGGQTGTARSLGLPHVPFLELLVLVVAILIAGLCALYVITNPLENILVVAGICTGVAVLLGILLLSSNLLEPQSVGPPSPAEPESQTPEIDGSDGPGGSDLNFLVFSVILIGTWFLVFALSLLFTRSPAAAEDSQPRDEEPDVRGDTPAAVGEAAGEAATKIANADDADLENQIYRAWLEMIELLPVEASRSTTPREFAAAAVDAGLDRDDVEELTELFESVRYGAAETTADREERAVQTLRRFESTYAPDGEVEVTS